MTNYIYQTAVLRNPSSKVGVLVPSKVRSRTVARIASVLLVLLPRWTVGPIIEEPANKCCATSSIRKCWLSSERTRPLSRVSSMQYSQNDLLERGA
jgi:hypothetical protein